MRLKQYDFLYARKHCCSNAFVFKQFLQLSENHILSMNYQLPIEIKSISSLEWRIISISKFNILDNALTSQMSTCVKQDIYDEQVFSALVTLRENRCIILFHLSRCNRNYDDSCSLTLKGDITAIQFQSRI